MALSPRSEALAFRIWAYCEPLGWDVTMQDVADALGVHCNRVVRMAGLKGWSGRFRRTQQLGWVERFAESNVPGRDNFLEQLETRGAA